MTHLGKDLVIGKEKPVSIPLCTLSQGDKYMHNLEDDLFYTLEHRDSSIDQFKKTMVYPIEWDGHTARPSYAEVHKINK